MKKIPVFTSILLIAGVLATMAFSHPLAVRNGVVSSYTPNGSITIHSHGFDQDYILRQGVTILPQNGASQLGAGARVTVVAECMHSGAISTSVAEKKAANGGAGGQANLHPCIALAVIVRGPAAGAIPATGGTGGTAAGTSTPAAGTTTPSTGGTGGTAAGTSTPAASATGTTGAATATPMVCPTATGTGTPAAGGGTTVTGTATAMMPCVTPTATP